MSRNAARAAPACPDCGSDARPVLTPANLARFAAIGAGIVLLTTFPMRVRMRCPACGRRFLFDTLKGAPAEFPDRACRRCDYDFTGLGVDVADCPECGLRRELAEPR